MTNGHCVENVFVAVDTEDKNSSQPSVQQSKEKDTSETNLPNLVSIREFTVQLKITINRNRYDQKRMSSEH